MSTRAYMSLSFGILLATISSGCMDNGNNAIATYTASYEEPCGRSLLVLKSADKDTAVQARGTNPILELQDSVLINTDLKVTGYFTGKKVDDHHCGSYPEFVVTHYEAAGPVSRCTLSSDWVMYEVAVIYPEGLSKDKLSDVDYVKNRHLLKEVPLAQCREVSSNTACEPAESRANSCGQGHYWCCSE